jgi:hypothetical protein
VYAHVHRRARSVCTSQNDRFPCVQATLHAAHDCSGPKGKTGPKAKLQRKAQQERLLASLACAALAYSSPARKRLQAEQQKKMLQRMIDAIDQLQTSAYAPGVNAEVVVASIQARVVRMQAGNEG